MASDESWARSSATENRLDDLFPAAEEWEAAKRHVRLPNDQVLAYIDIGESEGRPLLLLHGFTDSSLSFYSIAGLLHGRRLIIPDLRGHGSSGRPSAGYSLPHFAEDARLLLQALRIDCAAVAGHSLGGKVAQCFARQHRELVDRLILIGTSADGRETNRALTAELEKLETLDPDGDFMMRWYANPGKVPLGFLARLRVDASTIPLATLRQILEGLSQNRAERQPPISVPAIVLWGDEDPFFNFSEQETLLATMTRAKLVRFPGHGHNPFWESPNEVARVMLQFLDS